jgi:hypothetical protein
MRRVTTLIPYDAPGGRDLQEIEVARFKCPASSGSAPCVVWARGYVQRGVPSVLATHGVTVADAPDNFKLDTFAVACPKLDDARTCDAEATLGGRESVMAVCELVEATIQQNECTIEPSRVVERLRSTIEQSIPRGVR